MDGGTGGGHLIDDHRGRCTIRPHLGADSVVAPSIGLGPPQHIIAARKRTKAMNRSRSLSLVMAVAALVLPARAAVVDLTSGTAGSVTVVPQSFNETRGVEISLVPPLDHIVGSMTLQGLFVSTPTATVGARIYRSGTGALIASAQVVVGNGGNQTVSIPISATLVSGVHYRVAFFVAAGGSGGSGLMFDPSPPSVGGFPYVDATGTLTVHQAYSIAADAFPTAMNIFVPLMRISLTPCSSGAVNLTSGPKGTVLGGQSFNETRGIDAMLQGDDDRLVQAMALSGLNIGQGPATVGARIYRTSNGSLLAAAATTVAAGSNQTVTIPMAATLTASTSYRFAFFVDAGGFAGSASVFDPAPPSIGGFPYSESTGTFLINQAYSLAADAFPTNLNAFAPLITIALDESACCPADVDGSSDVNVDDLIAVIVSWGACPPSSCAGDTNSDAQVNVDDLVQVILSWGACP